MKNFYASSINADALGNPEKFIEECTERYLDAVDIAANLLALKEKKIIMLAGPSSSGKTTTARLLKKALGEHGIHAVTVSLDDFYHDDYALYPLNEDGSYNYESVQALNLPLVQKCFRELMENGKSSLPVFDFKTHKRFDNANPIELGRGSAVIVEGIHGLNPLITENLPDDAMGKVYVSVSSRIKGADGEITLRKRDLRLIRRLVRDYNFRGTSADETLSVWESVCRGEDEYIFPFRDNASIKLNSFHECEIGLLAGMARELLQSSISAENRPLADKLLEGLRGMETIDGSLLPEDCLLHEFIG